MFLLFFKTNVHVSLFFFFSQRDRLEDVLRELTPDRTKIAEAMVWCLDHAEAAEEVVDCIAESLSIIQTPIPKKVGHCHILACFLYVKNVFKIMFLLDVVQLAT